MSEREKQELEDLKRPGKLDEEELFVEEYVINEIHEGLTEKEKEDKDKIEDIKGKGKEMKVLPKLELEKDEEHTVDTVGELGRYLNEVLEDIKKEEEKKFGLDDEEVRTWAENIEEENIFEEKISEEIFEKDDEKVINTAEILSSSTESSSESDKESEIIEIVEIPNFDFTIIYTEDLTFENLFGENFEEDFEIFEMALNIAKCRKYDGSENPEDWIKEFERVARANAWVDADHANNSLSYNFAIAHLEGEAADWFEENRVTFTRWNMGDNHAARLRGGLIARFMTPGRQRDEIREYYKVRHEMGESVDSFAQRFKKAARKVGNNVADDGKIMDFIERLLPAIRPWANMGNQNTLDEAIASAKRGEQNAMGFARQLIPEQTFTSENNRIYQDMGKEKNKDVMEELMKEFKEMKLHYMNQGRNNYRRNDNYNRNRNNNIECYSCGERGHIRPDCPNNRRIENNNRVNENNRAYRNNDRNNNGNYENTNRDNRNRRTNNNREINYFESLNYNRTTLEEGNVFDTEYSSEEDNNENEKGIFMTTRSGRKVNSESQKEQNIKHQDRTKKARET